MGFNSTVFSFKSNVLFKNKNLLISFFSVLIGLLTGLAAYGLTITVFPEVAAEFFTMSFDICSKTKTELFSAFILKGLPYCIIMFILGGSIFGKLCTIITVVKTMGISLVASYLYCNLGLQGVVYALLVFFPGKIVLIFSLLLATKSGLEMSEYIINCDKTTIIKQIKSYSIAHIVILVISFFSWFIDFICFVVFSGLLEQ